MHGTAHTLTATGVLIAFHSIRFLRRDRRGIHCASTPNAGQLAVRHDRHEHPPMARRRQQNDSRRWSQWFQKALQVGPHGIVCSWPRTHVTFDVRYVVRFEFLGHDKHNRRHRWSVPQHVGLPAVLRCTLDESHAGSTIEASLFHWACSPPRDHKRVEELLLMKRSSVQSVQIWLRERLHSLLQKRNRQKDHCALRAQDVEPMTCRSCRLCRIGAYPYQQRRSKQQSQP